MKTDLPKALYVGRGRDDKLIAFNAIYSDEQKYIRADILNLPKNISTGLAFYSCAFVWKNIGEIIDGRFGVLMILAAIIWLFIAIVFMIKSHFKGEWA